MTLFDFRVRYAGLSEVTRVSSEIVGVHGD